MNNLGVLLRNNGRHDEAIAVFGEALRLLRTEDDGHPDIALMLTNQGRTELMRPVPDTLAARVLLKEALEVQRTTLQADQVCPFPGTSYDYL